MKGSEKSGPFLWVNKGFVFWVDAFVFWVASQGSPFSGNPKKAMDFN